MSAHTHPPRHVFVQRAGPSRLDELDLRAEYDSPFRGAVVEADYLRPAPETSGVVAWFRSLLGEREEAHVRVSPPFDARGADVFDYFGRNPAPEFDGHDDPLGEVRHARGRVLCLHPRHPGDEVVLRDFWALDDAPWRVCDAVDFGLVTPSGRPVAVCCAMAPLVVATPEACTAGEAIDALQERHREMLTDAERADGARAGLRVTLREGDEIEVLGVVCDPSRSTKRFDVTGRGAPFRSAAWEPVSLILGDTPGVRMVIRRTGGR